MPLVLKQVLMPSLACLIPLTSFFFYPFLPSANEVCEGYVFTGVCHSVHRGGGVSRTIPRREVEGSGHGGLLLECILVY